MSTMYDAIIVGAGQAGPALANRLTTAGLSVAVVERRAFGGTCVNTGCTPTKTLIASAQVAHTARRAAEYGIQTGAVGIDMAAIRGRKERIVAASRNSVEGWLRNMPRCTVLQGHARFGSPDEIIVDGKSLRAEKIFLNVGGRAVIPAMPGLDAIPYLTNTSMLELESLPEHLVIIGGSYIGLEFAQMYRRFGAAVTVVEKADRLISREDDDVSSAVADVFAAEGIAVRTGAECIRFEARGSNIAVGVDCPHGDREIVGSHVLLAVGRRPNTDDLGLDRAGIVTDAHGYVTVDEQLRTNVPGIWALGDCNGRGAFTHTAYDDFEIVAANILDGRQRRVSDRIACYGLFIDPPLGRVGQTERAARDAGRRVRVGSRPMTRVGRAVERGETRGFMKIIVDADTDRICGASILGVGGDEAIHGILDTMRAGASFETLRDAMHIHPTVSELIPTVLGELGPPSR